MKGTKTQKGITLIALIITIVVLLILAVVAVNSIQNDGILAHAGNAAGTYNDAVLNEQGMLGTYEDFLKWNSCTGHEYENGACKKCGYPPCAGGQHTYVAVEGETCERECSKCGEKTWSHDDASTSGMAGWDATCADCGEVCEHETYDKLEYNEAGHYTETYCKYCSACNEMGSSPSEHTYDDNNVCTVCGYKYNCNANGHIYSDNICTVCGYEFSCEHSYTGGEYGVEGTCQHCGATCPHDENLGNGAYGECWLCGYMCKHMNEKILSYSYMENNEHDTNLECLDCGATYCRADTGSLEACEDGEDEDTLCDKCGHELPAESGSDDSGEDNTTCQEHQWEYSWDVENFVCSVCGTEIDCEHTNATGNGYSDSGMGYHYIDRYCPDCELFLAGDYFEFYEDCADSDNSGSCDKCGCEM